MSTAGLSYLSSCSCSRCVSVGPGDLLHRTDLHTDGLQGVGVTFPGGPAHSDSVQRAISPPTINPIWIGTVTVTVPGRPQERSGTVSVPGVLVFVEGGKLLSNLRTQAVSYRNTTSV